MAKLTSILCALALLCIAQGCQQAVPILNYMGFTSLRPPSNLYQAGAVVAIEFDTTNGVRSIVGLKLVCGPRASLGPDWMPFESQTLASSQRQSSKQSWHIEGEALEKIKSRTDMSEVSDVSVTLENARILEMQDTDVYENVYKRSPECQEAIEARLKGGYAVTMVSSNIVADITYNVSFKREAHLEKKAQLERMHDLAVTLGGGHTYLDESHIQALNLAVGIKTDSFLLQISIPKHLRQKPPDVDRAIHSLQLDADARPDAPVVKASGGEVQRIRGAKPNP